MRKGDGGPWEALHRAYAAADRRPDLPDAVAAPTRESEELRRDLAEERAAICQYVGGLSRCSAEDLARKAHGLSSVRAAQS